MSLAEIAIENRTVTYFSVFLLVAGGIASFFALGQLEDPEFTVKTAVVATAYPGASPREVELEVTDRVEKAIQELPQLKHTYSTLFRSKLKLSEALEALEADAEKFEEVRYFLEFVRTSERGVIR